MPNQAQPQTWLEQIIVLTHPQPQKKVAEGEHLAQVAVVVEVIQQVVT
jgi:hypothetical protein